MDLFESDTHSFVIKIWLEETTDEAGNVLWRGQITHVPSGKRSYIRVLDDISFFILPYLQEMQAQPGYYWRMRKWLKNQWTPLKT